MKSICMFLHILFILSTWSSRATATPLIPMREVSSSEGVLETSLNVDQYFYENEKTLTKFWTRVYSPPTTTGQILHPGPVLRFRRGDTVTVKVNNHLGHENEVATELNSFHYVNVTNLHTHGLHISAEPPQDDVTIAIHPQDSYTYIYQIPNDHAAGTFWYHAHHHGSTAVQVAGGLLGAIVIEDEEEDIPPQFINMPEVILLMSDIPVYDLMTAYTSTTGDALFQNPDNVYNDDDEFVVVNGQYQPTGSILQGEWTRLRLIFSGLTVGMELQKTSDSANCEWYLLAKDGIYVEGAPRTLGDTVFLGPGNRADVVMRCLSIGEVVLGTTSTASGLVQQNVIVTFNVEASNEGDDIDLPQFTPYHPDYLADLYTSTNTIPFNMTFGFQSGGCTINGESWNPLNALGDVETGSIQEWTLTGISRHPFHLHVNSYQLKDVRDDTESNYYRDGDWHDTLYPPTGVIVGKVLFAVDSFVTKSILHCHFLPHEDLGCMGYMQHIGDEGATTGLTGHAMWCLGSSTGTAQYYSNCTLIE